MLQHWHARWQPKWATAACLVCHNGLQLLSCFLHHTRSWRAVCPTGYGFAKGAFPFKIWPDTACASHISHYITIKNVSAIVVQELRANHQPSLMLNRKG